ncbi:hypothetical protein BpHYR1_049748 [Brachionus plicatilis]|uniref:Uncharacterized protein n=1 Tax=Brachionus plicatilis TaxID=10195 RepID=A0A3M7Q5S5_BRAPC|nr:hypothetical protein BpHYR1_049748 [Brachionus plicatilis]
MRNKLALVIPLLKTKNVALATASSSFIPSCTNSFFSLMNALEVKRSVTSVPMLTTAPPIPHVAPIPLAATIEIPPVNGASKSAPTNRPAPAVDTDVPIARFSCGILSRILKPDLRPTLFFGR